MPWPFTNLPLRPGGSDNERANDLFEEIKLLLDAIEVGAGLTIEEIQDTIDLDQVSDATTNKLLTATERTKLSGIETGATADQTGAEIAAAIDIENTTARTAFASGDKLLIWEDGVGNRQIDYDDLPGASGTGVTSVNGQTGVATLDADDIDDTSTTNKFTTAAEISKLAGIEAGATADQTGAEIAALIDADDIDDSSTTNKFVDAALITKVSGIEAGAEVNRTNAELATDIDIQNTTNRTAFASGDKLLIWEAGVGNRRIDYDDLPGSGSFDQTTGFTTANGSASRALEDRFDEVINVLDYGADPTGGTSSTSAINSAMSDLRALAGGTSQVRACLWFPPNRSGSTAYYLIDGNGINATDLRGDGLCHIDAYGAVLYGDMNSGLPMIDMSHSQGVSWHGGTIMGDSTNPPRVGLQLTRKYTGPPTGNNTNPSSQGHYIQELTTTGHFTVAGMLNYGSEELCCVRCTFENQRNTTSSYAVVQNGMHDSDNLPTSFYDTVGWGEYTGFANNVFIKCFFLHNDGASNGGPGVYLFRPSGHKYIACLAQVRQDQPHFVVPHRAGVSTNASRDVEISGRYEDSNGNSLIYFTGDAGGIHHGYKIQIDRMFAQSLFMADSSWSDGAGVAVEDVEVRVSNVTPQAVSANPAGYAQVFRNKAKFIRVSGDITISQRSNAGTTFVDTRDFDIDQFNGTLKVSDRDEIPALPGGNFTLYDDTDVQPIEYATEITYTVQLKDTSGDTSSSTATAKTWREKDIQYVLFRDLSSISATGMTSGDAIRITLPVACADEDFVFGHIVATNLASEPTPTGNILGVRIEIGTGNNYATLRACDSGSATTALLTVGNMTGANIREFYVGYKVT